MASNYLTFNPNIKEAAKLDGCATEQVPVQPMPLQHVWHIWEQVQQDNKQKDYSANTRDLASFDTVQKFWQLWSYMPQPSELLDHKRMVREDENGVTHVVDALMIFKEGIQPMWEDPVNLEGGHFEYRLRPTCSGGQIDEYWNNLVLGLVGGTIEGVEHITGVRLVDKLSQGRNGCIRIEVWFGKIDPPKVAEQLWEEVNKCMAAKIDGSRGPVPKGDMRFHGAGPKQ